MLNQLIYTNITLMLKFPNSKSIFNHLGLHRCPEGPVPRARAAAERQRRPPRDGEGEEGEEAAGREGEEHVRENVQVRPRHEKGEEDERKPFGNRFHSSSLDYLRVLERLEALSPASEFKVSVTTGRCPCPSKSR